ncbi:uncharacterized protein PHACADRAFT_138388 [Phanerochaete carnosa HHB-10118-sp]|uniref:Peptidase A1 domain-containing protein n=1 Tax=Phanerochaete carnosa (strain HHB-10118-sp) TaxID=650164 RepID=K5WKQ4_PHACS|nr:uncharacterized protein PHACADRAFT_138388 [Phanerochaete carnosa HHB-10118-sp]EKM59995.1 hypothetical protein PHACADRAFT_138388 [Phanerochaete carnosa HHB-10118-sp]
MLSRRLVYALFCAHVASAVRLGFFGKRDTSALPQRLTIPLAFDSQGRYVAAVTMGSSNQQHFNFAMTTQNGLTYVAGTQCSTCNGVALYNQSQSPSAQALSTDTTVPLLGQTANSTIIKEDCMLRTVNGTQWDYPNQTIIVVTQPAQGQLAQASSAQVGDELSGLIGLGTNKNVTSTGNSTIYQAQFEDSIFGQFLQGNPSMVNFTFGMRLGKPLNIPRGNGSANSAVSTAGDPGTLDWLQPDESAYDQSKLQVLSAGTPQAPAPFANASGDWYVSLDGWVLASGNDQVSNSKSVVATVDPLYTEMYLPQDQAQLIHDAIPGSNLRPDLSSLGSLSEAWTVPCNSTFSYGIVVGNQVFTVDESTLVLQQPDGTCVSGIEAWTDSTQSQYVFGARFLSTLYLIFNVPRQGGNTLGFAPLTANKKSNHVGAIVGGVIGGVAFLALAGFAIFFFVYRHRGRAHRITAARYDSGQEIEKPQDGSVNPFPLSATTPTTVQFVHAPESSVGWDGMSQVPSPNNATYGNTGTGEDILALDIAPPSYETSEADRRTSNAASRTSLLQTIPSAEKAQFAAAHADGPSGLRSAGYASSPLSPASPNEAAASGSGTGSDTMYE